MITKYIVFYFLKRKIKKFNILNNNIGWFTEMKKLFSSDDRRTPVRIKDTKTKQPTLNAFKIIIKF